MILDHCTSHMLINIDNIHSLSVLFTHLIQQQLLMESREARAPPRTPKRDPDKWGLGRQESPAELVRLTAELVK